MRTHVTHALTYAFLFHSCVSRARTLRVSARSPLGFLYGVCQLATMDFFTQMKGSARNVCTFFNVPWHYTGQRKKSEGQVHSSPRGLFLSQNFPCKWGTGRPSPPLPQPAFHLPQYPTREPVQRLKQRMS